VFPCLYGEYCRQVDNQSLIEPDLRIFALSSLHR
jgi:hypothetical protein